MHLPAGPRLRRALWWPLIGSLVLLQAATAGYGSLVAAGKINPYGYSYPRPDPPPPVLGNRVAQLQTDIAYLARELPRVYAGGHVLVGVRRKNFQAAAAALSRQIPSLTPPQQYVGFMRLLATLHDGETGIALPSTAQLPILPMDVRWYGNDLRIVAAPPGHRDLLGGRIIAVGSTPIATVRKLVDEVLPAVTNWERNSVYHFYMRYGFILQGLGLITSANTAPLTVQDLQGRTQHVSVAAEFTSAGDPPGMIYPPTTIATENARLPYWWRYLPDANIAYVKYNQCVDDGGFQKIADKAVAAAEAHPRSRFVIDLRGNDGGNSAPFDTLLKDLQGTTLDQRGRIYAITDRLTFSAATLDAVKLRTQTHAILVGEPTGDPIDQWGNQLYLQLTGYLPVHYSTTHYDSPTYHAKPYVAPDLSTPTSLHDLLTGRDPALAAVVEGAE